MPVAAALQETRSLANPVLRQDLDNESTTYQDKPPPEHDEVDVSMVIKTLTQNASNAQNMIKEVIKTFKNFSADKDPANDCLNTAIITDSKLRTKKTIKKLQYIAGRVLKSK